MFRRALTLAPTLANHTSKRGLALNDVKGHISNAKVYLNNVDYSKMGRVFMMELGPPTPMELPRAFKDGIRLFTKGNWKNVTVREAWLNTLLTTEVLCWFFVGEVIGKGTLIGYQV